MFYITSTNQGIRMMIYSGIFTVEDPTLSEIGGGESRLLIPSSSEISTGVALVSRKVRSDNFQRSVAPGNSNRSFSERRDDALKNSQRNSNN